MTKARHSTRRTTILDFLTIVDSLRNRQRSPWHAFTASLRRSFAEPLRYGIGLGWAVGWTVVSQLLGDNVSTVAITAVIFALLISSLAVFPWRVRILPRRVRSRWLMLAANGVFASIFGYACFTISIWTAALAYHGTAVLGEDFLANVQLFGRLSSIGFIFPLIGLPITMGEEYERSMRTMKGRERRMTRLAEEAQQIALRSQINPHFFFNSLNTIAALIPTRPQEAERAVELLAESLRPVLMRTPSLTATVESEFAVAKAYGRMEQLRLGERLRLEFHYEDEAANAVLPSLCVQPLLENAITHGVANRAGVQHVLVEARIEADHVAVDIRDGDAIEWTEEQRLAARRATSEDGHAVGNVTARLRSLHGDGAMLDVRVGDAGCWARLRAPAQFAEQDSTRHPEPAALVESA